MDESRPVACLLMVGALVEDGVIRTGAFGSAIAWKATGEDFTAAHLLALEEELGVGEVDGAFGQTAFLEDPGAAGEGGVGDKVGPDGAAEDFVDAVIDAMADQLDDGWLQCGDVACVEEAGAVVAGGGSGQVDCRFAVHFGHLQDFRENERLGIVHDAKGVDPKIAEA